MAKPQKPVKKKIRIVKNKPVRAKKAIQSPARTLASPEYREYLDRYSMVGDDRPKLSAADFEKFDDELLDLLALQNLEDEQAIRKQELEYLLIDSEE